jgi:hypothetical protein
MEVVDDASRTACIAAFSIAAKEPKLEPVGEASDPRKPVSTSLPMVTMSGMAPAWRYISISDLT